MPGELAGWVASDGKGRAGIAPQGSNRSASRSPRLRSGQKQRRCRPMSAEPTSHWRIVAERGETEGATAHPRHTAREIPREISIFGKATG